MQRSILPIAIASAVIGAGAAVGLVEGLGAGVGQDDDHDVVQQAPFGGPATRDDSDTGLTARRHLQARRAGRGVRPLADRAAHAVALRLRAAPGAARRGDRLGLRHRQGRHHPHQRPRRQRRDQGHASSSRTSRASTGQGAGQGRVHRPRAAAGRPDGPRASRRWRSARRKGVQVGDPAIAIGNPFGLERTLTTGVDLRGPAHDPGAQQLRDRRRAADRRADQPRQLRRPAASTRPAR